MRRLVALSAITGAAVLGGPISAASADPSPSSHGCQVIVVKHENPSAPGHQGIANAAEQGRGEGPCGFGSPPGHEVDEG